MKQRTYINNHHRIESSPNLLKSSHSQHLPHNDYKLSKRIRILHLFRFYPFICSVRPLLIMFKMSPTQQILAGPIGFCSSTYLAGIGLAVPGVFHSQFNHTNCFYSYFIPQIENFNSQLVSDFIFILKIKIDLICFPFS
jgi:hypothetical protein